VLYHLFVPLADDVSVFNVFRYITFRSGAAVMTALVISFLVGPGVIAWLKRRQREGQPIRDDGPESHLLTKKGTPTMGGFLILLALSISTLLWADLTNGFVWAVLLVTIGFGAVGFGDDYLKLTRRNSKGLPGKLKLTAQVLIALLASLWLVKISPADFETHLAVPFFKDLLLNLGWFFVPFAIFVMVGASNAVNLTDGLDELAAGLTAISAATMGIFAYVAGRTDMSRYLGFFYLEGAGELTIFAFALAGAALGFLWFNAHPAEVFMGDTGSLALGGALGAMAILLKAEFLLVIVGGVFVLETLSVIVQKGWFKYTKRRFGEGRRVFRMAPIHHHFEKLGWSEPKVVIRFWILGVLFAMVAFSTLKVR
jgi:phospho-N-acetylmuramoyl-pentapeptide-transferase